MGWGGGCVCGKSPKTEKKISRKIRYPDSGHQGVSADFLHEFGLLFLTNNTDFLLASKNECVCVYFK